MKSIKEIVKEKPYVGWLLFIFSLIIVFLLGLLIASISERRAEAIFTNAPKLDIPQWEPRNQVWGINYPRQYDSYLKGKEEQKEEEERDMLASDPRLVVLWAGYGFSKEYNKPKGHIHSINDIRNILRTGAPKDDNDGPAPNTCWSCKSTDVPRMMMEKGTAEFYKGKWASKGPEIVNAIGCADCHDSKTMNLRFSRPALTEAFDRQGRDILKSGFQEMRTLVCAQCHVEYYFRGKDNYLTFPWDKGLSVKEIEKYYDSINFSDWTHQLSKAPMLKAQHPDYELFVKGIHSQRGLSCSDCHLPYFNEGGQKFTNHHVESPLNNISNTCQVCHRQSEETLKMNVKERKEKIKEIMNEVENQLVRAHFEAKAAWDAGAAEQMMKPVLTLIRHSQWRWDFVAASHGSYFHAPLEASRILSSALNKAMEARLALSSILINLNVKLPVVLPDISTKDKAQKYIGIDIAKLNAEKKQFIEMIVPLWDAKAAKRQSKYPVY